INAPMMVILLDSMMHSVQVRGTVVVNLKYLRSPCLCFLLYFYLFDCMVSLRDFTTSGALHSEGQRFLIITSFLSMTKVSGTPMMPSSLLLVSSLSRNADSLYPDLLIKIGR